MGSETMETYNNEILVGGCQDESVRGVLDGLPYRAWHYDPRYQGELSNHYDGPVPVGDIRRRLLDWQILELPLKLNSLQMIGDCPVEVTVDDPSRKVLVRSDTLRVLHVVGSDYTTPNYMNDVVNFGESVVADSDGAIYIASAGLLRGGGQFWTQFMCPEIRVQAGFAFQPFLTITDSCDGRHWEIVRGSTAVVCDNTLTCALSQRVDHAKVKHTRHARAHQAEAARIVGLISEFGDQLAKRVEILANTPVNDREWDAFLSEHFGAPGDSKRSQTVNQKNRDFLTELYTVDPMVAPWTGTALGVVQAVNTDKKHHTNTNTKAGVVDPMARFFAETNRGVYGQLDARTIDELNSAFTAARRVGQFKKELVFA